VSCASQQPHEADARQWVSGQQNFVLWRAPLMRSVGHIMEANKMTPSDDVESTWSTLERFLSGDIPTPDFENWVYGAGDLARAVGREDHLSLISFDFRQAHAESHLHPLVLHIYERHRPGCLARDRARRVAKALVHGTIDVIDGVRALARLNQEGNIWVPVIFVGLDSELDQVPRAKQWPLWDQESLAATLNRLQPLIEHCRRQAIEAAKELLKEPECPTAA
jgi:hypothetical protein